MYGQLAQAISGTASLAEAKPNGLTILDCFTVSFPSYSVNVAKALIYLVKYNRDISTEYAITELDLQGFRHAMLKELQALCRVAAVSNIRYNNPIVGLGTLLPASDGYVSVPFLRSDGGERYLDSVGLTDDWSPDWLFAVLRK
jgi:hypothetical protein